LLVKGGSYLFSTWHTVTHSTMDWMANGNSGRTNIDGPLTLNFTTYHYAVGLYISPDSSGNMHGSFTTPRYQPPAVS
jgi:hypothetical protein